MLINLNTIIICHDHNYNQEQTQQFVLELGRFKSQNQIYSCSSKEKYFKQAGYYKLINFQITENMVIYLTASNKNRMAIAVFDKMRVFCLHTEVTKHIRNVKIVCFKG